MKLVRGEDIENDIAFPSCFNTLSKSEAEKLVVITLQNIQPHRQNIIYVRHMTLQSEHLYFYFKSGIDKSTEWSTIPVCPSLMCSFNSVVQKGPIFRKFCVRCLCMLYFM